jgi:histone-binding protein RBBP4
MADILTEEERKALAAATIVGKIDDPTNIHALAKEKPEVYENYTGWKTTAGAFYERILGCQLAYPSLTVKWLPDFDQADDAVTYKVLLGQNTSGNEQNHLILASIEVLKTRFDRFSNDVNANVNADKALSFDILKSINHPGAVNRCAYSPQASHLVSTMTESGDALLFDLREHPKETPDGDLHVQARLRHHTKEGYAVEWNPAVAGSLATGANDAAVCIWDASKLPGQKRDAAGVGRAAPVRALIAAQGGHTAGVMDLSWSHMDEHLLATCGEDKQLLVWDTRAYSVAHRVENAHEADVNSVAMARKTAHVLATGGEEGIVKVWDLRNLNAPTSELQRHTGSILSIAWNPLNADQLATSSADTDVLLWSLSNEGERPTKQNVVFEHNGHCGSVMEVAWCEDPKYESVMLVSVSEEDNIIHIWEPNNDDEDNEDSEDSE